MNAVEYSNAQFLTGAKKLLLFLLKLGFSAVCLMILLTSGYLAVIFITSWQFGLDINSPEYKPISKFLIYTTLLLFFWSFIRICVVLPMFVERGSASIIESWVITRKLAFALWLPLLLVELLGIAFRPLYESIADQHLSSLVRLLVESFLHSSLLCIVQAAWNECKQYTISIEQIDARIRPAPVAD
ncbi:hypothetical protein [Polycladidibacter hongkongensis]|uniref:hypothetical protein n=1 Tax=Polycladidibacter hongkongensis TaxID=1647556 RepID=UPI0008338DB6|nr:hypothetical protein [Pseudovibrio hongkongensis]